jgi:transcriptional regulator
MYIPPHFREDRPEVLREFISLHPLGMLVGSAPADGLTANPIPMLWEAREGTPHGVLRGHVAKANPVWRDLADSSAVLVLFGGANHYVSPGWYPSKAEHGKVVPTWNYAVVQARGRIRFDVDEQHALQHLNAMTDLQESGQPAPWKVTDAPAEFVEALVRRVVPFEIAISDLAGKFKASQNQAERDRHGVAAGLQGTTLPAQSRSELVRSPQGAPGG